LDTEAIDLWRSVIQLAASAGRPSIVVATPGPAPATGAPLTVITLGDMAS
jgi:hypothetical protein